MSDEEEEEGEQACECTSRGSGRKGVHVLVLQKMMFQVFLEFPLRHKFLVLSKVVILMVSPKTNLVLSHAGESVIDFCGMIRIQAFLQNVCGILNAIRVL